MGKSRSWLERTFGEPAQVHYHEGDMTGIRTYHRYRAEKGLDPFTIDDITWNDLSMDDVYKEINCTLSTSGEQVLYHMLRTPLVEEPAHRSRARLIEKMGRDSRLRLDLQEILARLGKRRAADTSGAFAPADYGPGGLIRALALVLGMIASLVVVLLGLEQAILPFLILLVATPSYRLYKTKQLEGDLPTVNYSAGMALACRKMSKAVAGDDLAPELEAFFAAGRRTRTIANLGGISFFTGNELMQLFNSVLLLDLISYELLKNRLARHRDDIFLIHEQLGQLDAAIAVASWRESLPQWCAPQVDFDPAVPSFLSQTDMCHPLVDEPVPNSLEADEPVLLTGSNASGKSTFLKGLAVNAILAQSVATALCAEYRATAFCIYSSMALSDNIFGGESYFIVEIKSLKRIVDASGRRERVFCVIDEILRGTNTVERVAASSQLLRHLAEQDVLCFAATHDIELCSLLEGRYRMLHFEEQVTGRGISFDYRLKPGPASSRNAIKLLELLGFDKALVDRANAKAQEYLETGRWQPDKPKE